MLAGGALKMVNLLLDVKEANWGRYENSRGPGQNSRGPGENSRGRVENSRGPGAPREGPGGSDLIGSL